MKDHRTKACAVNSTPLESLNLPRFLKPEDLQALF